MSRRAYEDDDGRTIADMSEVSAPNLFTWRRSEREEEPEPAADPEKPPFTKRESRLYALAALRAALLIGCAFAAGLGLIILVFWLLI